MMSLKDEEIQRLLDLNLPIAPTPDVDLYKAVYKELGHTPTVDLNGLANNVVLHVQRRKEWNEFITSIFITMICGLLGTATFMAVAVSVGGSLLNKSMSFLLHYKIVWIYLGGILLICKILDRKLFNRMSVTSSI